jgi:hypothetical protein
MGELVVLEADYGYFAYRATSIEETIIDASGASWIVSNLGQKINKYPFLIDKSDKIVAIGGAIYGEVPLNIDWVDAYQNSAAVFMRDTTNAVVRDWTINQAWDAIRIDGDADNFLIDHVYLHDIRDDGVENDDGLNGIIRNSLFDGVFVGVSLADPWSEPAQENIVKLEKILMRMENFWYRGVFTHGAMLKVDKTSPSIDVHNSVFAISDVHHVDQWRVKLGWDKVRNSAGNYFLNLTDQPFPQDYPLPQFGFTILEGAEAREHWNIASQVWLTCSARQAAGEMRERCGE